MAENVFPFFFSIFYVHFLFRLAFLPKLPSSMKRISFRFRKQPKKNFKKNVSASRQIDKQIFFSLRRKMNKNQCLVRFPIFVVCTLPQVSRFFQKSHPIYTPPPAHSILSFHGWNFLLMGRRSENEIGRRKTGTWKWKLGIDL